MKSRVSNEARHNGLEEAKTKFVELFLLKNPLPDIPLPSSTFCLARFLALGSAVFDQSGLKKSPQPGRIKTVDIRKVIVKNLLIFMINKSIIL
tara:strand:+ start:465 stop:743 length:279 start_codon:yes stop_codon:yes gene_type:complete